MYTPIDLKDLVERFDIPLKSLAVELFPDNVHPMAALKRAIAGESVITADQVSKLADLLAVDVNFLYSEKGWEGEYQNGVHVFTKNGFKAYLRLAEGRTTLYKDGVKLHTTVLHSRTIPLSEYLTEIERSINLIK